MAGCRNPFTTCRVLSAALTLLLAALAVPAAAREAILDYQSRIVVNVDSSLTVTETLRVRAEGNEIKRGIFRAFPTLYAGERGGAVRVPFEVLAVERDGRPEPYHVEPAANGKVVYVGQADVLLKPGDYTYRLTYRTGRQIGHFADYDELYWNVTGGDWALPRERIEAVVVLPPGGRVVQQAAYTGLKGQRGEDYAVDRDGDGNIRYRTTRAFGPGEDLTIAVAWPKGLVDEPAAGERLRMALGDHAGLVAGLVGLLLVLAVHGVIWRRVGRDPKRGTIVPQFAPPKGLSPAAVRSVLRMGLDDKAFAVAIVDMAVKGYLSIDAGERYFTLRRTSDVADGLPPDEEAVAERLFAGKRRKVDVVQDNHAIIGAARNALSVALAAGFGGALFSYNRRHLMPGLVLSVLTLMVAIAVSPSTSDTAGVVVFATFAMIGLAVFGTVAVGHWKKALTAGVPANRRIGAALVGSVLVAVPLVFAGVALGMAAETRALPLFGVIAVLVAANLLFFRLMRAPTAAGRKLMDAIEGFRLYLTAADQPWLQALNPPALTPELFEKYLPYALALDIENAWSERFVAGLGAAAHATDYRPAWYCGHDWDWRDGSAIAGSLGGGLAGALSSSATAPGSTGGGGGSDGGGSSGGGGGGGGGGGW